MTGGERFAALVETMLDRPGTTYGSNGSRPQRAFGSTSLKTAGKIFAMLVNGHLVVKLDRRRVDALIASGDGERFDPGHGRLQKEWLAIESASSDDVWLALATEAEAFVAGRGRAV
jgi:TfoX/Sxy family transcriptional regulator of competence genes